MRVHAALQKTFDHFQYRNVDITAYTGMTRNHVSMIRNTSDDNFLSIDGLNKIVSTLPDEARVYFCYLLSQPSSDD
jgi:DNA-binding Xre family transcriptional regulator